MRNWSWGRSGISGGAADAARVAPTVNRSEKTTVRRSTWNFALNFTWTALRMPLFKAPWTMQPAIGVGIFSFVRIVQS